MGARDGRHVSVHRCQHGLPTARPCRSGDTRAGGCTLDLDDATWGGGVAVALTARSSVWASVRQEATDPLYWNTTRRTWSVGLTQRLGRITSPIRLVPATESGGVLVTLRAADAPSGEISIAGDFNNWQPTPMQREGDRWVVRLLIGAGVYHYAFRSSTGTWFVPSSRPDVVTMAWAVMSPC